jgi:hypothetical protein
MISTGSDIALVDTDSYNPNQYTLVPRFIVPDSLAVAHRKDISFFLKSSRFCFQDSHRGLGLIYVIVEPVIVKVCTCGTVMLSPPASRRPGNRQQEVIAVMSMTLLFVALHVFNNFN